MVSEGLATANKMAATYNNAMDINALFKTPFELKQAAEVPNFDKINITFDDKFLNFTNSGIDKNIVWTFNSLQPGDTQVIVTVHGGTVDFVMVKTYNVHIRIVVPNAAVTANIPELSFLSFVDIAAKIIKAKKPGTQLLRVRMQSQQHGIYMSTADPTSLSCLEVDFQNRDEFLGRIKSARWGTWHEPHLLCQESRVESQRLFSWPVKMDIAEATTLL
ncbi:hypothetical protein FPQ18DRAFT_386137 [Pyronema domesticum]|nr:hypothetical protein FPQ18DRAFT_386137 [Pyronema domesticum]